MFCKPTEPDPDNCGTLRLESDVEVTVTPGNVLIVFDQSGSMGDGWPGTGTSKLQAAQTALVSALTPLQDNLSAGAIFFPSFACIPVLPPPPGGAVAPLGAPEQIDFMPGPAFLQAWNTKWATPSISLGIGTPLQEAFDRADIAIQNTPFTGQLAVVVFTDGQPTCLPDPNLTMIPTALETDRATAWLGNNIKTYVVGLPGANGVAILDQIAQAGGTNSYIVPDDPATLEAELRTIVEETVKRGFDSCSINLTPAADVPDELLLIVEESGVDGVQQVPRDLGWSLSGDGAHVEITGTLCDDVMTGRFSSITFEYACPEAPPPPVLPPPD